MADFPGAKIRASDGVLVTPGQLPSIPRDRPDLMGATIRLVESSAALGLGLFTNTQPVELRASTVPGAMTRSFYDDFYNRVYYLPPVIDFGSVSGDTQVIVRVWNAYKESSLLISLTGINATGITYEGPEVPTSFGPLQIREYTFTAGDLGPPSIAATFRFVFESPSGLEPYDLFARGQRAKVAPFAPNWRAGYTINYSFRTEIITSESGKEQRRALRSTPRKKIEFEATPTGAQFRELNRLMASWHNNVILMPEEPRRARLVLAAAAGSTTVDIDRAPPDWIAPGLTAIMVDGGRAESRRIQAIVGRTIHFEGPSQHAYRAGSFMHPALVGRLAGSIAGKRATSTATTIAVDFDVTPASEPPLPVDEAPHTLNGRELFLVRPNWSSPPDVTYESERDEIDYERGRTEIFTPVDFTSRTTKFTFLGRDYEGARALEHFFLRQKGQRGEFYMPTWDDDIPIAYLAPATTRELRVLGMDFYAEYRDSTVFRAVRIALRDGRTFHSTIESVSSIDDAFGQDSTVAMTDALPFDVSPENVAMVSWMPVCRFAMDGLTIEWVTSAVAQCQFSVRTLEDL